jgi:geranylgeranyl pyrophosphate synthase
MADSAQTKWHAPDLWELPSAHATHIKVARQSLLARLSRAPAGHTLREYFERGKMLRAFLVFASSASVGSDPERVIMAAEAIELLHTASLFHDDIIDQASVRRGLASLHERVGIGQALVLGDDLLLLAMETLSGARSRHSAARVLKAMDVLSRCARECCRGQFDELCADRWISEEEYLAIVIGKTAAPFVAAGMLGALLGGGTKGQVTQISVYARQMGLAFQIDDDLLDLTGDADVLGKPAGNSLAHGRPMLPLIYLWRDSSETTRKKLRRLANGGCSRDDLLPLFEEHGTVEQVRLAQRRHFENAIDALEGLPDVRGVESLRGLATSATERVGQGTPPECLISRHAQ